jgi:spermidine synthase
MSSLGKAWKWFIEWIQDGEGCLRRIDKIIAYGNTGLQEYMIAELAGLGKSFILDGKVQSSISDEYWYHEALVHPPLLAHECPKRVLVIGGGEGATVREVLKHKCVEKVYMVDIDEKLLELAKEKMVEWHQGVFDDNRLRVVIDDGRKYLERTTEKFDAIILDLVDPMEGGPAALLYTLEFYETVKRALNSNGVMVTQATSPVLTPEVYATIYNTISKVFKIVAPYITYVKAYNGLWGFVYASDTYDPRKLTAEEVDKRIRENIKGKLRFYDGTTHVWMFSVPKPIRDILTRTKNIATDSNPTFIPA